MREVTSQGKLLPQNIEETGRLDTVNHKLLEKQPIRRNPWEPVLGQQTCSVIDELWEGGSVEVCSREAQSYRDPHNFLSLTYGNCITFSQGFEEKLLCASAEGKGIK